MRDEYYLERYKIEQADRWSEIIKEIPFIQFPADWKIRVIPPFGGLQARFQVQLPNGNEKSVYLDYYDRAGCMGSPYWEVYPVRGDCGRCFRDNVEELLELIAAPGDESSPPAHREGQS